MFLIVIPETECKMAMNVFNYYPRIEYKMTINDFNCHSRTRMQGDNGCF